MSTDGGSSLPELSIVVPCRDAAATLPAQLDALLAQQPQPDAPSFEIVVVDNGSVDGTASLVESYAARDPRVRLVAATDGRGANVARNHGMRAAQSDRVAFCDADDIVGPRWVAAMATALREHGCVTGPLDVHQLNPAWLVRTRGELPSDGPRMHNGVVPVVPGGNMAWRRSVWAQVGGFREELDTAGEDVELSLRLLQGGVGVGFASDAVVAYRYRSEPGVLFRQGRAYGRAKPWLCELMRREHLPTPSRFAGWKSWLLVVAWLPRLVSRKGRAAWCWVAGSRLGQLEGCVRTRAVWL